MFAFDSWLDSSLEMIRMKVSSRNITSYSKKKNLGEISMFTLSSHGLLYKNMVVIYEENTKIIHSDFLMFLSSLQEKHLGVF